MTQLRKKFRQIKWDIYYLFLGLVPTLIIIGVFTLSMILLIKLCVT